MCLQLKVAQRRPGHDAAPSCARAGGGVSPASQMLRGVLGSVPSCREVGAVARLPRRIVGTLGGVDPADTALADLIAGQSEERRLEMEEVAAGIMETFGCDDEQILIELTGIFAGATGMEPMRWEVEEAVRAALAAQA